MNSLTQKSNEAKTLLHLYKNLLLKLNDNDSSGEENNNTAAAAATATEDAILITNTLFDLQTIFSSLYVFNPLKSIRLQILQSEIFDLAYEIVNAEPGYYSDQLILSCWLILESTMAVSDLNSKDNLETVTMAVEKKLIELGLKELQYRPPRSNADFITRALTCLTSPASFPEFSTYLLARNAHVICLKFAQDFADYIEDKYFASVIRSCISVLSWLSRFQLDSIRDLKGLADLAIYFLPCLQSDDEKTLLLGFVCARCLIRVFGKNDTMKIIQENPIILQVYPKLLKEILQVGAGKNYLLYNSYWSLSSIALDFSILSSLSGEQQQQQSSNIKSSLIPVIPLTLEMLIYHHKSDRDVIRYGIRFLSQLVTDKNCLQVLIKNKKQIQMIQHIILTDCSQDKENLTLLGEVVELVLS
jgi:hypothetical protein